MVNEANDEQSSKAQSLTSVTVWGIFNSSRLTHPLKQRSSIFLMLPKDTFSKLTHPSKQSDCKDVTSLGTLNSFSKIHPLKA